MQKGRGENWKREGMKRWKERDGRFLDAQKSYHDEMKRYALKRKHWRRILRNEVQKKGQQSQKGEKKR